MISTTTTQLNINTSLNPSTGASSFVPLLSQSFTSPDIPFNVWAQMFHKASANGLAYGFSCDDVGDQQPAITTGTTSSLRIQLGRFD